MKEISIGLVVGLGRIQQWERIWGSWRISMSICLHLVIHIWEGNATSFHVSILLDDSCAAADTCYYSSFGSVNLFHWFEWYYLTRCLRWIICRILINLWGVLFIYYFSELNKWIMCLLSINNLRDKRLYIFEAEFLYESIMVLSKNKINNLNPNKIRNMDWCREENMGDTLINGCIRNAIK